ncbi:MAG: ABC transporter ATP-binding protein [Chloroflexota bacterium]
MEKKTAIKIEGLHRYYDDIQAVRGASLEIEEGMIFSLLGPNGAGKSTTISVIAGLLQPTEGEVEIMGYPVSTDAQQAKKFIGVVPQEIALYDDLSGRENLLFWGRMYDLSGDELQTRVDQILDLVELSDRQKDKVEKYSGGMKRRLNLGIALLHEPEIVIMDEPTVGIDPQSRRKILDSVKALNKAGMTVLYTTHYMEEAQELSDQIAIMDQGEIIARGTNDELVKIVGEYDRVELVFSSELPAKVNSWDTLPGVSQVTIEGQYANLLVEDANLVLPKLFESAGKANLQITAVNIFEPNLETVFLHLTGRALRD